MEIEKSINENITWAALQHLDFPLVGYLGNQALKRSERDEWLTFYYGLKNVFCENSSKPPGKSILTVFHFHGETSITHVSAVKTHNPDMGSYRTDSGLLIPAYLDWKHHGAPCQTYSQQNGGDSYPTISASKLWEVIDLLEDTVPFPSREIRKNYYRSYFD